MSEKKFVENIANEGDAGGVQVASMVPTLPKRYVIYSPGWGVFLGGDGELYSKRDATMITADRLAPTFNAFSEYIRSAGKPTPKDAKLVEVFPTGPDNQATAEDCRRRMLPGWDF